MNTEAREALLALATAVEAAAKACRTLADTMEAEPELHWSQTCRHVRSIADDDGCVRPVHHTGEHRDAHGVDW